MKRAWIGLILLPLLCAVASADPATSLPAPAGSRFSPQQRAEIVQILRDALRNDPSILRDAIVALREDEQAQQGQQDRQAVAANRAALFDDPADPVFGNPHGTVALVEFFDVRCPYCRRMRPTIDALVARNPDLRIVMKNLPILGPSSVLGAKALLAAAGRPGYAKLQDALMGEGVVVDRPTIERAVRAAGLDWPAIAARMDTPEIQHRIDATLALAGKLGLHGTPAIIFADQIAPGALSEQDLQRVVDSLRHHAG